MTEARARLDALPTTFPKVFSSGPMPWGFEHGDGWVYLIEALCEHLNKLLSDEPGARMEVLQVKEKFGTLRFYYRLYGASDSLDALIDAAVDIAVAASGKTCERCGHEAKLITDQGWWSTLCPSCKADST